MKKTIYLVRHGQSESNVGEIQRERASKLTEHGHEQAKILAERFKKLPVDIIISSGFPRAHDTAQHIVRAIEKPYAEVDIFGERRPPSKAIGLKRTDPVLVAYEESFWNLFHDPQWRHEDSENFSDLNERAAACLEYLAQRPEEHIVVVGHGLFVRVLVARMLFGEELTGRECLKLMRFLQTENTGITVVVYDPRSPYGVWQMKTWNDHAHLG